MMLWQVFPATSAKITGKRKEQGDGGHETAGLEFNRTGRLIRPAVICIGS
jgi:hypothetical protein